jgi:UPF0176 protein
MSDTIIAAFYQFTDLPGFESLRQPLLTLGQDEGVFGTILLAHEGINGTISGPRAGVDAVLAHLKAFPGCAALQWKEARADQNPFYRLKVRLKKEIVTLGVPGLSPQNSHQDYVAPKDWNAVISDPQTLLIDTRNAYEVSIGTFKGAIDPGTTSFREFPKWFAEFQKNNNITRLAMFCTGGIRCEKSTAFVRTLGVDNVVHLQGGILNYLETVPKAQSLWEGECFVFDHRVSVNHDLAPGAYDLCHACRLPITEADKASAHYQKGVSCPACYHTHDAKRREALAERQKQMELAAARGQVHLGAAQHKGP